MRRSANHSCGCRARKPAPCGPRTWKRRHRVSAATLTTSSVWKPACWNARNSPTSSPVRTRPIAWLLSPLRALHTSAAPCTSRVTHVACGRGGLR
jgi:hypothetical protein